MAEQQGTGRDEPLKDESGTRAYHPSELPPHLKDALRSVRMDPRHAHLDRLMDDGPG